MKQSKPTFVRLQPGGPGNKGLEEWDAIDPAGLEAGTPVQSGHIYHEEEAHGYLAGVWGCTPMTEKFGPYTVHEFMFLLEGSITMVAADGTEVTVNAGEAFVIPKGLPCQWKQTDYVRKYFMILEDPSGNPAKNVASQNVIVPEPFGPAAGMKLEPIADPAPIIGDLPTQHNHTYFTDPSGQMVCGVWDTTPFVRTVIPFPRNELMCILEGTVTLTDGDGQTHLVKAGEAVYVPKGAMLGWKCTEYVRKFYSIFSPDNPGSS